jgi:hypothetical protein
MILRAAGLTVEPHNKHFGPRTPDEEWLTRCGECGWIALAKDDRIRYSPLAKQRIMDGGVRLFVLIGRWPHGQLARNFVNTLGRVTALIRDQEEPFIARVYMAPDPVRSRGGSGEVKLYLTRSEWLAQLAARGQSPSTTTPHES